MSSRIAIEQIKKINQLIVKKNTGKPAEMAVKLDCSLTTLFTYLSMMRTMGAPIQYNKFKQTYYYEEEGDFVIGFIAR
jgi:predicted DNA-binding transcriptional regulator YafY